MRLHLTIDRQSRHPLWAQIHDQLRRAITEGALAAGSRLPSTRALAMRLKVSRNTILAAYETLAAEGLIAGASGSATRVASAEPARKRPKRVTLRSVLRASQYPVDPVECRDPDGNPVYVHE